MEDSIALISLNSGENRLNSDFVSAFLDVLDDIEANTTATALVVKSNHEKIFSNGLDLDWIIPLVNAGKIEIFGGFIKDLVKLYRRILMFPVPTVAAINGHAYAGGAILTCYFDYRFMRSDRGYICFPEVDLGIPFLPGMMAAMRHVIPVHILTGMVIEGKRLTGIECETNNIIIKACPNETVVNEAILFAKSIRKRREIIYEIKKELYKAILFAIDYEDPKVIESGRFNV
jgi:enoyl-CoA hydratase/carnithine racemase